MCFLDFIITFGLLFFKFLVYVMFFVFVFITKDTGNINSLTKLPILFLDVYCCLKECTRIKFDDWSAFDIEYLLKIFMLLLLLLCTTLNLILKPKKFHYKGIVNISTYLHNKYYAIFSPLQHPKYQSLLLFLLQHTLNQVLKVRKNSLHLSQSTIMKEKKDQTEETT